VLSVLWIIGIRPISEMFITPLEYAYSPPDIQEILDQEIYEVVVLSGGYISGSNSQLTSNKLSWGTMSRFLCGFELCGLIGSESKLIVSGGMEDESIENSIRVLSHRLNPHQIILTEAQSLRTIDHPKNVRPLLTGKNLILITSAIHMRRSMSVFRRAGLDPVPYPVRYSFPNKYSFNDFVPDIYKIAFYKHIIYEYLANLYYFIFE